MTLSSATFVALLSLGTAYIVCGSKIGRAVRVPVSLLLRLVRLGRLDALVRCPPCHAFWAGAFWVWFLRGFNLSDMIIGAVVSCGLVAVAHLFIGGAGLGGEEDIDALYAKWRAQNRSTDKP